MKLILRAESIGIFLFVLYLYQMFQFNWWLFAILLFVPDISMIGYSIDNKMGAYTYNIFHTYLLPILFMTIGLLLNYLLLQEIALIFFAHIAMDRALGYGLKYSTGFKDTHLKNV